MPYNYFYYFTTLSVYLLLGFINAELNQEMSDQGRAQYQLLLERKNLPTYGSCWKSAIEHIEGSCQSLSEETQSSIALHLANCFLEMSGHESYNCELEKKSNLRQICISSMSDRAFHVYTEFYTHTQNICWFLRGQVWQETIAENTFHLSKQLEQSAKNQENILRIQKESLDVQEKLMRHAHELEKIMDEYRVLAVMHHEILSSGLKSLQSWLIGEFSWIDLIVFYVSSSILIVVLTSSKQTAAARFSLWILLIFNIVLEHLVCSYVLNVSKGDHFYSTLSVYIWWVRKAFCVFALITLIYFAYFYKDLNMINNDLLQKVYKQNLTILKGLGDFEDKKVQIVPNQISVVQEKTRIKSLSPTLENSIGKNTDKEPKVHLGSAFKYNLRSKSRSPWDKTC